MSQYPSFLDVPQTSTAVDEFERTVENLNDAVQQSTSVEQAADVLAAVRNRDYLEALADLNGIDTLTESGWPLGSQSLRQAILNDRWVPYPANADGKDAPIVTRAPIDRAVMLAAATGVYLTPAQRAANQLRDTVATRVRKYGRPAAHSWALGYLMAEINNADTLDAAKAASDAIDQGLLSAS